MCVQIPYSIKEAAGYTGEYIITSLSLDAQAGDDGIPFDYTLEEMADRLTPADLTAFSAAMNAAPEDKKKV